jgi:diamine N-acetyltransferase
VIGLYQNEAFVHSDKIVIRNTNSKDLLYVTHLESKAENKEFIIPWDIEKHRQALFDKDKLHLIIEDTNNKPVGYMILAGINGPNDSIELIRITISDKGKGFGKEALRLIQHWAFTKHFANRLWLDVKIHNTRALHVYQSLGFLLEGKLRECIKIGDKYESLYIMSILRSDYEKNREDGYTLCIW